MAGLFLMAMVTAVFYLKNEFARGKSRVNLIEGFWSFVKRRMEKFNLHLKECEFRFNYRKSNFYGKILKNLKEI